jgi:hypothetical protein
MSGLEHRERGAGSVYDDGQFIVEVVSGGGGHGTGAIGFVESLHTPRLKRRHGQVWGRGVELPLESAKNKNMLA